MSTESAHQAPWGEDASPYAFTPGDVFLLDHEPDPQPIWGDAQDVLWSPGEPCYITGPIGVGKTTLVGRLVRGRLGLDNHVLGYRVRHGERNVLYLACDRPRQISRNLRRMMADADRPTLAQRLVVWQGPPPGDLAKYNGLLLDMCRKADADTVVIDGLKDVAVELSKDDVGAGLNQAVQRCVAEGIEVIGNHHQRKAAGGATTKPRNLADLYGSTWIGAGAGTVVLMWADNPGASVVEVNTLKPAYEHVGPITVLHDLDDGTLAQVDAIAIEDVLKAARDPLPLAHIMSALGDDATDRNARERVRRRLRKLDADGMADSLEHNTDSGGRAEKFYFWCGP